MKQKTKLLIGWGIVCVVLLLASSWYAVTFNDSRLVVPMEFQSYEFQTKDLPMILSVSLACIYGITLLITLVFSGCKQSQQIERTNKTRKLNPKLGFLGFFGFLGFGGFWTYSMDGSVFPFAFFLFFGFFGFFYEGKMSGTFMDERFRENATRANLKASNIALSVIFLALLILCQGKLFGSLDYTLIAVIIALSISLALRMFLAEYLLYRYDHDDHAVESED